MTGAKPDISAVVVTLGESPRLMRCLKALRKYGPAGMAITCVVSSAGPELTETRDGVVFVNPGINVGWPGGCHIGRMQTDAALLWFLQDDVFVHPGAGDALRSALDANQALVAVRPVVVDEGGRIPAGSCGAILDKSGRPASIVPRSAIPLAAFNAPSDLSYLPSSGLMIRASTWDRTCGFNPWLYPVQCNDQDLGCALKERSLAFRLVPEARVEHRGKASTPTSLGHFCAERNREILAATWFDGPAPTLASPAIVASARAYRADHTTLTASRIRDIVGAAAADCLLHFARWQAPGFDEMADAYRETVEARDWWREQAEAWQRKAEGSS